jgi:hypothetical protein
VDPDSVGTRGRLRCEWCNFGPTNVRAGLALLIPLEDRIKRWFRNRNKCELLLAPFRAAPMAVGEQPLLTLTSVGEGRKKLTLLKNWHPEWIRRMARLPSYQHVFDGKVFILAHFTAHTAASMCAAFTTFFSLTEVPDESPCQRKCLECVAGVFSGLVSSVSFQRILQRLVEFGVLCHVISWLWQHAFLVFGGQLQE